MLDRFYFGALSLLLVFYSEVVESVLLRRGKSEHDTPFFKVGNATGEEGRPHEPALLFSREGPAGTIDKGEYSKAWATASTARCFIWFGPCQVKKNVLGV